MEEIKKIEWSDSYLIGVQEIDLQHKKLISIANELYDVVAGEEENYKEKNAENPEKADGLHGISL